MKWINSPSPEDLQRLLSYDPVSGQLTWKSRAAAEFPNPAMRKNWNYRYAGKPAFAKLSPHGYLIGTVLYKQRFAHRVAWAVEHGEWPDGEIDHINGNRADNRLANLRVVSGYENNRNKALQKDRGDETIGVSWARVSQRWVAAIGVGGRRRHLGQFPNKADAIAVRKKAERELGYHPNHGRKP